MKKYEMNMANPLNISGTSLYQIRALRDFGNVKKGDLGGFIEKEENLSHDGNCWVDSGSTIRGNALVCDNALVRSYSMINDNAYVSGNAVVFDKSIVFMNARISGNACICDSSCIGCNAIIDGDVTIYNQAFIGENAKIHKQTDFVIFVNICNDLSIMTFYKSKDSIMVYIESYPSDINVNHYEIREFEKCVKDNANDISKRILLAAIEIVKMQLSL